MAGITGAIAATVEICNQWEEHGTGFFVLREKPKGCFSVFLVTNKHVLADTEELREEATDISLHLALFDFETPTPGNSTELLYLVSQWRKVLLTGRNGRRLWQGHSDANVDVLALDFTEAYVQLMAEGLTVSHRFFDYELIADEWLLKKLNISAGDEIVVTSFPGFEPLVRHDRWPFAFVKQGIVTSHISLNLKVGAGLSQKILPAFLVDGLTVFGASGSPVVLRSSLASKQPSDTLALPDAVVLGTIADTTFAAVPQEVPRMEVQAFGGVGLAFNGRTIRETISQFYTPGKELTVVAPPDDITLREPGLGDSRPGGGWNVRRVAARNRQRPNT